MQMSEREIVLDYNAAKDKGGQIEILAQLNLCSKKEIEEILEKNGVKPAPPKKKPGTKPGQKVGPRKKKEPVIEVVEEVCDESKIREIFEEYPKLTTYEEEQADRTLSIPVTVRRLCEERAEVLMKQIMALEKEYDEIQDFLMGVVKNDKAS